MHLQAVRFKRPVNLEWSARFKLGVTYTVAINTDPDVVPLIPNVYHDHGWYIHIFIHTRVSYWCVDRITFVWWRRRRRWLRCADRGFSRARSDVTGNSNRGWRVDSLWLLSSLLFRLRAIVLVVVVGDNKHVYTTRRLLAFFFFFLCLTNGIFYIIQSTTLCIVSITFSKLLRCRIL